jgi:hypothetical protein
MPPDGPHGALPEPAFATEALTINSLQHAVEARQGCAARFVESVVVWELLKGEIVEERIVHVFDLCGHPEAMTAYAWRSPSERHSNIVLRQGEIAGPDDAVRAVIFACR